MKKYLGIFFGAVLAAAFVGFFAGQVQHPVGVSAQSGSTCSGPYIQTGTGQNCVIGLPAAYTLPTATSTVLGGVKPDGTTLANTAGAISVATPVTSTNVVAAIAGHAIVPTKITLTAVAPTVAAGQVGMGSTVDAPGANNCPATVVTGCLVVNVAGTLRDVPYY